MSRHCASVTEEQNLGDRGKRRRSEEEEASDTESDKPSDTEGDEPQVLKPELEDMIQLCDDGDHYDFTSDFLDKWVHIQSPLLKEVPSNHVNTDRF